MRSISSDEAPTIKFKLFNNLIIIPGLVNRHGPFEFVVDTGASISAVSKWVASESNIKGSARRMKHRGVGAGSVGDIDIGFARVKSLGLTGVRIPNLLVTVLDFASFERKFGRRIGGLIGCDVLKRFDAVKIDFVAQVLELGVKSNATIRKKSGRA